MNAYDMSGFKNAHNAFWWETPNIKQLLQEQLDMRPSDTSDIYSRAGGKMLHDRENWTGLGNTGSAAVILNCNVATN